MSITPPPTLEGPVTATAPAQPPARRRREPGAILPALILIALGLVFLAGNIFTLGGGALFLGLALAFLLARLLTGAYGFAVPAGILLGFGAFISLEEARLLPTSDGGLFFMLLGLGFLAVYLIGGRPRAVWPLFPATVLVTFGAILRGLVHVEPFAQFVWLGTYWPLILIGVGLWLLGRDRLPAAARAPLAVVGVLLIVLYGALVLAAAGAAAARPAVGALPGFVWTLSGAAGLPVVETEMLSGPLPAGATLRIDNPNGRTSIRAAAGDEVRVTATKRSSIPQAQPGVVLRPAGDGLLLETRLPSAFGPRAVVDYAIEAPAGARIETTSASGDIEISGMTGPVQATSTSGDVTLTALSGAASARSVSGDLRLTDIQGDLRASSTSGDIAGSGLVHPREISTTSGDVNLAGLFADEGSVNAVSGDVTLRFAPGSSVRLDVTTLSGDIRPRAPGLVTTAQERRHLTGTLGAGTATLSIRTASGDVTLMGAP